MISNKTIQSKQTQSPGRAAKRQSHVRAKKQGQPAARDKRASRSEAAKSAPRRARKVSKQQVCLELLGRPEGASIEDLQKATGWQAHTVRGFLSGAVKRKLGMEVVSEKPEDQTRRYRISQAGA